MKVVGITILRMGGEDPIPLSMACDLSSYGFFQRQVSIFCLKVHDWQLYACWIWYQWWYGYWQREGLQYIPLSTGWKWEIRGRINISIPTYMNTNWYGEIEKLHFALGWLRWSILCNSFIHHLLTHIISLYSSQIPIICSKLTTINNTTHIYNNTKTNNIF